MPVVVQCFHCNAILELDDGFRGGVCRCSSCGSLLQVPRGDDAPPTRKVRPAMPPPPSAPVTPAQNATSSRLDVGLSRGQFDVPSSPMRQDIGVSSGLRHVHQTKPITASPSRRRSVESPAPAGATTPAAAQTSAPVVPPAPRSRALLWLGLTLVLLAMGVLVAMIVYYLHFYPGS
jgi:hypothetical protein